MFPKRLSLELKCDRHNKVNTNRRVFQTVPRLILTYPNRSSDRRICLPGRYSPVGGRLDVWRMFSSDAHRR